MIILPETQPLMTEKVKSASSFPSLSVARIQNVRSHPEQCTPVPLHLAEILAQSTPYTARDQNREAFSRVKLQ